MAMVMPIPSKRLLNLLEVIFFRMTSSLLPASFSRPDDMTFIPYRKNARPPNRVMTEKISITFSPYFRELAQKSADQAPD